MIQNWKILRRILAFVAICAAVALLLSLIALWFSPAPFVDVTESGTHIVFRASQPITFGRCGDVSWQVGENVGIWVNGQGVASEGTMSVCVDPNFTRPQINVALPDGSWRLYELPVTSLIYSGAMALTFAVRVTLAILLFIAAAWLLRQHGDSPSLAAEMPATNQAPQMEKGQGGEVNRIALALCFIVWLIYLAANGYLRLNTPITSAPAEAYVTPTTIQQVWDSAERPITIPLIYKLLNNDFEAIAWLQWGLAMLCWSALACMTLLHLRSNVLRVLACALILGLSLARDVYFWNSVLISESISQSLFILLVAVGMFVLWVYQRRAFSVVAQVMAAVGVLILTVIWSFTRDTNSYVALAMGGLLGLVVVVRMFTTIPPTLFPRLRLEGGEKQERTGVLKPLPEVGAGVGVGSNTYNRLILPALLTIGFVALFVYQNQDANRGLRWRYPLMNIIARRVLPYPDNTAFFAARGMPTTPDVMRSAGQFAWAYDLTPIEPWLTQESRSVYLQYLMADPINTVMTPLNQWEMILLFDYPVIQEHRPDIQPPAWIATLTGAVYPEHMGLIIFSIIGLLLLMWWAWRAPDMRLAIVVTLLLLLYPLAFMVWYGDGFAVERHAVPSAIQWRLTIWLAILFSLDKLLPNLSARSRY
jgi:hypothetical protein